MDLKIGEHLKLKFSFELILQLIIPALQLVKTLYNNSEIWKSSMLLLLYDDVVIVMLGKLGDDDGQVGGAVIVANTRKLNPIQLWSKALFDLNLNCE